MDSGDETSTFKRADGNQVLLDHGYSLTDKSNNDKTDKILDTVGAVAVDQNGNVASAASSGGIMFKGAIFFTLLFD